MKDGGSAFPAQEEREWQLPGMSGKTLHHVPGMSLRDYFAAAALPAVAQMAVQVAVAAVSAGQEHPAELLSHQKWAEAAYQAADAMLAEREKGQN